MFDEWILPNSWQVIVAGLAIILHRHSVWRLHLVMIGILFAKGRKTITNWFRDAVGHANITTTSVYTHVVRDGDEPGDVFDFWQ